MECLSEEGEVRKKLSKGERQYQKENEDGLHAKKVGYIPSEEMFKT